MVEESKKPLDVQGVIINTKIGVEIAEDGAVKVRSKCIING